MNRNLHPARALILATVVLLSAGVMPRTASAQTVNARPADDQTSDSLAADGPVDRIDDVFVTARRAGLPIWQVERGGSTVVLIGAISGVPRGFEWRPEALEAATARSQRILYPQEGRASAADLLRLLWRIRTIAKLPNDTTTADYLSPPLQARLETVMSGERSQAWRTQSLVGLGFDLLDKAGYDRRGRGAVEAVRHAARQGHIEGRPVGIVRGDEMVDNLITQPPGAYLPCVEAAISAAEAGPAGAQQRLEAWRSLHVPEVLATPLDRALNLCWPSGDADIAPVLRRQWAEATQAALAQPGVTLGIVSLRILAEPGGVLDQLEARGLEVTGPRWRPGERAQ
ncbi:hypothetical protein BH10PSE2_BH10PSE2_22430 [soil metagenome]